MQATRFLVPRLAGDFEAGLIHFSLVRVADLNSVLRANFGAYKTRDELHFTSVLSFLAVRNVSVLICWCSFVL